VPLIVTPGAIVRLVNGPTGADSNITNVLTPDAAASNVAASAAELGKGVPGPAPGSSAVKTIGAACATPAVSENSAAAAIIVRALMSLSLSEMAGVDLLSRKDADVEASLDQPYRRDRDDAQ
jgi:hypothetical protein